MKIRSFQESDVPALIELFRGAVHTVCRKDYLPEQLLAWAPNEVDETIWTQRLLNTFTVVAEENDTILGFSNLESDGNIDMLYVHAGHQRRGIAKQLYERLATQAKGLHLSLLRSDVSITARPFFLKMGFKIDKEYTKNVRRSEFRNVLMSLQLTK
jgi:putative acetyltransferase